MMSRRRHFVGTVPCVTPEEGIRAALLDDPDRTVRTMSDTESTDGRGDYIIPILQARTEHPSIVTLKGLHYYDRETFHLWNTCVCVPRPGRYVTGDALCLSYARHAAEWFPVFERVTADLGRDDVLFQADVATPVTMGALTWGPGFFARYDDELDAAVREIERIVDITSGRCAIQLSAPVETVLTVWTPGKARGLSWLMANRIVRVAEASPAGTVFLVHLCLGRPRGKPMATLKDLSPITVLIDAIVAQWPAGRVLSGIHFPVGDVIHPAPVTPEYYAAMNGLTVPPGVDLVAGLANLNAPDAHQRAALRLAERAAGRELAVSTPCGMGSDQAVVSPTLRRVRDLSVMPPASGPWTYLDAEGMGRVDE